MKYTNILFVLFCIFSSNILAQSDQQKITLLDLDNALPIVGASFEYGNQQGTSNDEGSIYFQYTQGQSMRLSHINYGRWTLSDAEVSRCIEQQVCYQKSATLHLYPVTVIALRQQARQPETQLKMDYQNRLEHDAANILRQIPAFSSIQKSGRYGFDPVFRGFKYDQLNIVLNGAQSATAACPNRMDPPTSQMAPNMMDRIEILKGPHALRYGTGLGATIHFIPEKLRFTSKPDTYGRVSAGYEDNGNVVRGETQLGFSGKRYDIGVFGSWSQGDDYATGNGESVAADFTRGSFGTNIGLKLSANQQLRLSATYNRARDAEFAALPMDLRDDDTWMFNARHDIHIGGDQLQHWNTTLFGSFVEHLMDNLLKPLDPRMLNAQTAATTQNYGARTEGVWHFGKNKLFAGADLRVEGAEGTRTRAFLMGPNAGNTFEDNAWQEGYIRKIGLFGEYQLNTHAFNYIFSGRLESNTANTNDPDDAFTQVYSDSETSQINPSVSIGMLKEFDNTLQAGLWLGRAQRSGSLTERFINYFPVGQDPYEMLGNPNLQPEINHQIDVSLQWNKKRTGIHLDIFTSYIQDYISSVIDPTLSPRLPSSPGVRPFVNIDEALKYGFEAIWIQQLTARMQHHLSLAYTYGQDLERDEPLPEIAPLDLRYTLSGNFLKDRLQPQVVFRYVTEQSRISREFGETRTPSFALLDLEIGYAITDQLRINAGVHNLLDENYYEHLNRSVRGANTPIYAPGRTIYANINFAF